MKKFLTVLLALSVVFTYTVGTAFALPSDGTEQAGLNAAKTQALTELNEQIDNISDYTEAGQLIINGKIAEYTAKINDATTISTVTSVLNSAKTDLARLKITYLKKAVVEAQVEALKQVKDYLYLFGYDVIATAITSTSIQLANMSIKQQEISTGNVKLDGLQLSPKDQAAFSDDYASQIKKLKAATSTDDVEKSLNDVIETIDKYMSKLSSTEVTDAERTALVNQILAYADAKSVDTTDHSTAIVKKYDAMVEEAVAAAKAVKTKAEYYEVINKYLGTNFGSGSAAGAVKSVIHETGAKVEPTPVKAGYAVVYQGHSYILVTTIGELDKLVNMKKNVEARIAALEEIQKELGAYDYKTISEGDWEQAEAIRYEITYYIENGAWDTSIPHQNLPVGNFMYYINQITAGQNAATVDLHIADAIDQYNALTLLPQAKAYAKGKIKTYYGYKLNGSVAASTDYSNPDQIADLQQLYSQYVDASATEDQVYDYLNKYYEKIDAYKTIEEAKIAKNFGEVSAYIDTVVANIIKDIKVSADQTTLKERIVSDLKASLQADYTQWDTNGALANWENLTTDARKIAAVETLTVPNAYGQPVNNFKAVIQNIRDFDTAKTFDAANQQKGLYGYGTLPHMANASNYSAANQKYLDAYQAELDAAKSADNWNAYLAAYDAQVAKADALKIAEVESYEALIKVAEDAISKLGTVENTSAFAARLATAKTAVDAVDNATFTVLTAKEQANLPYISNFDVYDQASYDLAYLKYQASLETNITDPAIVNAYKAIAKGITTATILNEFGKADRQAILEIVTKATDAIDETNDNAAKVSLAEKAINDLKAFKPAVDGRDYAAALAANKEEAVKYFNKYYNAAFTSDAVNATALVEDILNFNKQFHNSVAEEKAAKIKAVESLKIVACSSAKKGSITVKWRIAGGDASAADGYQVYKSTKAQKNYKFMGKTKKLSMINKKNLKKGTRYFYKVRAYVDIDGVRYYSDWSNKANRYAK